ncbi:MAG: hypothetical protein FWG40_01740 [Peptococcaceae bacterium]|nr:hypothetical protein [Peptococcaceae bacterium]
MQVRAVSFCLSFIRYLRQEQESELFLDPAEEDELHGLLASGNVVDASEVLTRIEELADD